MKNNNGNTKKQAGGKEKKRMGIIRRFFSGSIVGWYDWLILLLLAGFCFLSYEMRDLYHTAGCSYGFLDGHFLDFYDYLAANGIAEDGSIGLHASYMPTVYLIFAVWNLPMKLLGIVPRASAQLSFIPIMWAKVLPCLAYLGSGVVVFMIGRALGMRDRKCKLLTYAFLSMPIGLYGQFILGQYESFIMLFVLLGTWAWLKQKKILFVAFFAVAVTFKYTAVLVFLPLLLLEEKKIWKILAMAAGVFVLFALEYLLFRNSAAFASYAFGIGSSGDNPTGYITNAAYFTGFELGSNLRYMVYLAFIAFALVCAYSYFLHPSEQELKFRYAVYLCGLALAAMFCFSKWHPHWLMLCVPFWTISAFMHRDTKIFMALDLLFMGLFVMFCTGYYVGVTDEVMLQNGMFKYILPDGKVTAAASMSEYLCKLDPSFLISLITAIMLVYALFKHPRFMSQDTNASADSSVWWVRARYVLGLLIFIVPSLLVVKNSVAGPVTAYLEENRAIFVSAEDIDGLSQSFVSQGTSLKKLKFPVSVGENSVGDRLTVCVLDEGGSIVWSDELNCGNCYEGELVVMKPGISLTQGAVYTVTFELSEASGNSSFCLLAAPGDAEHQNASAGEEEQTYHLDMNIYQ